MAMQEAEWTKSHDAVAMLESMPKPRVDRTLRLFACACCRHFGDVLADRPVAEALQTAEKFADGKTSRAALKRARQSVRAIRHALPDADDNRIEWVALWLVEVAASENAFGQVAHEIQRFLSEGVLKPGEQPPAASLLRCIAGNPFQPLAISPRWRTSEVVALASAIDDEAAFDRMPQLATALKNAGCTDTQILKHCRSKGPHAPGCWVVDRLLGKT